MTCGPMVVGCGCGLVGEPRLQTLGKVDGDGQIAVGAAEEVVEGGGAGQYLRQRGEEVVVEVEFVVEWEWLQGGLGREGEDEDRGAGGDGDGGGVNGEAVHNPLQSRTAIIL